MTFWSASNKLYQLNNKQSGEEEGNDLFPRNPIVMRERFFQGEEYNERPPRSLRREGLVVEEEVMQKEGCRRSNTVFDQQHLARMTMAPP